MIRDLARRIEGINADSLVQLGVVAVRRFPEVAPAHISVAGGVAAFLGADAPVSYAVGLGFEGMVSDDEVARVVEFYRARGVVPRVDACPYAHPGLPDALRRQGFQLHWFMNVLARPLTPSDDIPLPPDGVRVRLAEAGEDELWARVVDEGFSEGAPLTVARRQLGLMLFHRDNMHAYFAEVDGEPAGAGALFTHDDGYAALMATSTRVAFRHRGVHAALIRARLARAQALGCNLAGFFASPGSISERNALRHGFRLAYTKATLKQG